VKGSLARATVVLAMLTGVAQAEQAVSAFAANVGLRGPSDETPPAVTLYVVPDGRTLLVTDVLVANRGGEAGPLYLSDSQHTRCAIQLVQNTLVNNGPGVFSTLSNAHASFTTGIPFAAGEPVVASVVGGTRGVDVTITGKLVPGRRLEPLRLPGGAREGGAQDERSRDDAPPGDYAPPASAR
jgi:hypothetical protein